MKDNRRGSIVALQWSEDAFDSSAKPSRRVRGEILTGYTCESGIQAYANMQVVMLASADGNAFGG